MGDSEWPYGQDVTILAIDDHRMIEGGIQSGLARFGEPVLNGDGVMQVLRNSGEDQMLTVVSVMYDSKGVRKKVGDLTDRLEVHWSPARDRITLAELVGAKVVLRV